MPSAKPRPKTQSVAAKPQHRPPLLVITSFVVFGLFLLFFITYQQLAAAESDRLRLLAGYSSRLESTLEDLAGRTVEPIRKDLPLEEYIRAVPALELLAEPVPAPPPEEPAYPLRLENQGSRLFFSYRPASPPAASGSEERRDEDQAFTVEVQLQRLAASFRPPRGFDAVYLANADGEIVLSHGEPELRVTRLESLLQGRSDSDPSGLVSFLGGLADGAGDGAVAGALPAAAAAFDTSLAGVTFRAFLQPVSIDLPLLEGELLPPPQKPWLVCGLVAESALLSTSYTSSPVLLALLIAVFPLALLIWPFAKILLITKRQRLRRFDLGSLAFATVFCLSLFTLLAFGTYFVLSVEQTLDEQLAELSRGIERAFRLEVEDAYCQLVDLDRSPPLPQMAGKPWTGPYPLFNSLSWIDRTGEQREKHYLLDGAESSLAAGTPLLTSVRDRRYLECVQDGTASPFERAREAGGYLPRSCPQAAGVYTSCGEGRECLEPLCLEPVLSRISGEDELVIARASERSDDDFAAVLSTRLSALTHPVLARGFGFAFVAPAGEVVFHSDPSRNLIESFLKAHQEDRVLESLLAERRTGLIDASYWGEPHRLHVRPLRGLPWSLVTFWSSSDLRLRAFVLAYDFLNPLLVYLVLVIGLIVGGFYLLPASYTENLWPHWRFTPVYRRVVLVAVAVTCGCAALFAFDAIRWIFAFSLLLPPAVLAFFVLLVERRQRWCREHPKGDPEGRDPAAEDRTLAGDGLYLVAAGLALLALFGTAWSRESGGDDLIWILFPIYGLLALPPLKLLSRALRAMKDMLESSEAARRKSTVQVETVPRSFAAILFFTLLVPFAALRLRVDLAVLFLLTAVAVGVLLFELYQHRFFFRQRRVAFRFCWTGLLFVVGVLPALGFLQLASSRQTQLMVMDTQLSLARVMEARQEALAKRSQKIDQRLETRLGRSRDRPEQGCDQVYCERLGQMEEIYLRSFQPWAGEASRPRFAWPQAIAAQNPFDRFIARLLASRFMPVSELAQRATSVDLSRFELELGEWRAYPVHLRGNIPSRLGLGAERELELRFPSDTHFYDDFLRRKWVGLVLLTGLLLALPALLASFLSERVFMIALAQSGGAADQSSWTIGGILEQARHSETNRTLLITRIPDLAVQLAKDDDWEKISYRAIVDSKQQLPADKPVVVTDFAPGAGQVDAFAASVDRHNHAIVLIAQENPAELFSEREDRTDDVPMSAQEIRRWRGLLSSFAERRGRDAGKTLWEYEDEIQEKIDVLKVREVGRPQLARLIANECGHTRRLQAIGCEIAADLSPQSYTKEEIISRITTLAHSYYRSIWEGCSIEEKLVLVRLAEDGMVSSYNFEHLLDLLQKGLIRRDPSMRLLNKSFGQFVLLSVTRADVQEWEEAGGLSAWSVIKWLLPLPLLLFGGFLFVTQRDSFSNMLGLLVALGSATPILINFYNLFQEATIRTQAAKELAAGT